MNTYQFVWAQDTHTFSCHHNTEPTTSTTRAGSSSDSSTGPLEARQMLIRGGSSGGGGSGGGARSRSSPVTGAGLGEGNRTEGERGGEKETKQTNQPTPPEKQSHSPRQRRPRRRQKRAQGQPPPSSPSAEPLGALHPRSAARPTQPHAATAGVQTRGGPGRAAVGVTPDTWVCTQGPSNRDDGELTLRGSPQRPQRTQRGRPLSAPAASPRAAPTARGHLALRGWSLPCPSRRSPSVSPRLPRPTRRYPLTTLGG